MIIRDVLFTIWNFIINIDPLISVIGFIIAIIEIRRVKSAALASKEASENALKTIANRLTISDISDITNGMREVQIALRGERYEAAVIRIQNVRYSLAQLKQRVGFTNDERKAEIQEMVLNLRKRQDQIERRLSNIETQLSIPAINGLLSDYISVLAEWAEQIRIPPQEK